MSGNPISTVIGGPEQAVTDDRSAVTYKSRAAKTGVATAELKVVLG